MEPLAAQHTLSILGCESLRLAEAKSFLEENKIRVPPQVLKSFSDVTPVTQSSGDFCFFSAYTKASGSARRLRRYCAALKIRQVENCRITGAGTAHASELRMEMSPSRQPPFRQPSSGVQRRVFCCRKRVKNEVVGSAALCQLAKQTPIDCKSFPDLKL